MTGSIAANIRAECARQFITRADLARATGLSYYRVGRIMHGEKIRIDDLVSVRDVLGVELMDLLADNR